MEMSWRYDESLHEEGIFKNEEGGHNVVRIIKKHGHYPFIFHMNCLKTILLTHN